MSKVIVTAPQYKRFAPFLKELLNHGVPANALPVYKGRNRIYKLTMGNLHVNIKVFKRPSFPNNYVYTTLRKSKARRSFENATRLLDMGFDTPQPIGYAEGRRCGHLVDSYYICLQLEGVHDMRYWLNDPEKRASLPGMAELLARLHANRIWHHDFSPGNILVGRDADGNRTYSLVDVNRMSFNVRNKRHLLRNLGTVYVESEKETARFGRLYAKAIGKDPEWGDDKARRQLQAYHDRKAMHRTIKRILNA